MVYQYSLEVTPDEFWEADKVMRVLKLKWKQITATIGPFVPAGKTVLTLQQISETIDWSVNFRGQNVQVRIPIESGKPIYLNDHFNNKDNDIKQTVLNLIINQAFRETNLRQIGRSPRFFDINAPINLPRSGLMIMPGFKASAFQTQMGCMLAIDNVFKFMCTTSCLEKIRELKDRSNS